jgi:ParB-like chromosome segregation protein Spo0J
MDENQDDQNIQSAGAPGAGQSLADFYGIESDTTAPAALAPVAEAPEAEGMELEEPGEESPAEAGGSKFARLAAQLEAAGIDSDDAIERMIEQESLKAGMEAELSALGEELQGRIDSGEITPELAQMLYEAKAQNLELAAQAQAQAAQMDRQKAQDSLQTLAKLSPELGQFAQQAGLAPAQAQALAQVLEPILGKTKQAAVSQYVAEKGAAGGGAATAPIPQGASSSPVPTDIDVSSMSYTDLFKLTGALN